MDLKFVVTDNTYSNIRDIIKNEFNISSRLYLKLRKANNIYINGKPNSLNKNISIGDIIEIDLSFKEDITNIVPINITLNIIYEDDYMLILNKPPNMPVHPSANHFEDSLSNGVKYYYNTINLHRKIRIVNRLDKDTSGIVIFAKNQYIQEALSLQMKTNQFKKEYIGILERNIG